MPFWSRQGQLLHIFREHHERLVKCQFQFSSTFGLHTPCFLRSVLSVRRYTYFLTYLLTCSLGQSPSWEANRFSASTKFPAFSLTRRFITAVTSARHVLFDCFATLYVFYYEELLAPRPAPKLQNHSLSAICDYLFNIFAATLHIRGISSIRNLRTRHAVVLGTHLSQPSDGIQSQITSFPCEGLYRQLVLVGMIFYAYLTPHYRATKKCFCQWHSGKIDCLLNMVSYRRV